MFLAFQKEMYDREVLTDEYGFVVYKLYNIPTLKEDGEHSLYLHSIFINKDKRGSRYGFKLFSKLLKKCPKNTVSVIGYVDKTATNYSYNKNLYMKLGAKIMKDTPTHTNFYLLLEKYNGPS